MTVHCTSLLTDESWIVIREDESLSVNLWAQCQCSPASFWEQLSYTERERERESHCNQSIIHSDCLILLSLFLLFSLRFCRPSDSNWPQTEQQAALIVQVFASAQPAVEAVATFRKSMIKRWLYKFINIMYLTIVWRWKKKRRKHACEQQMFQLSSPKKNK